ncbi:dynamin-related protein 3A isoform X2 [Physcomitrium patens]|uniref:dynamin-related protein 3A isoform X2 n=1 Tax=Physcomitrium patens TaxID=3218 RepID=UPI000D16D4A9|nr:dynamin-related protein 3A-like isoform X1 [Physcomitrium patens]|eukprot:XP_024362051.1 dynamin-related protein 3A-like isoform X1 [Physcomitrella patens]
MMVTMAPSSEVPGSPSGSPPASPPPAAAFLGQSVIPLVNKLQDILCQLGSASTIDLPQVAVVGSQSSGKSSVLEALVGKDFLPRSSDICTRRPLVLQLVQTLRRSDEKSELVEWGEFLHIPGRQFTNFSAIRKEIQLETERDMGTNKGISEKQIRLKIFSPDVLNITLVDLPGITKVPVGDQPTDIEARVRTMILSYIKHKTCIILAVSPANADLANSDALQMARIADPDGSRTIGVISKLDIMDRGTDARSLLLGNVIPLRLGYVGVVNRSQEDISRNRSIRDALTNEENFFRSRPVYHNLSDRCGVPQLAKKLNTILVQHIKAVLPDLKSRISNQMIFLQKELTSYGELTDSKSGQAALLLGIITKYSSDYQSIVEGNYEEMSTTELSGGARIHYIFQEIFVRGLEVLVWPLNVGGKVTVVFYFILNQMEILMELELVQEVDPCDVLTDEDIRTAIQNATGPKNVLFVPEVPFEVLVRRQIARLLEPSLQCARYIYDELVKISQRCESYELQRFPLLRRRIDEVVANFLRDGLAPAETMIGHLIEMEMDYINTSHPAFLGGSKAVEVALQQQRSSMVLTSNTIKAKDMHDCKETRAERLLILEKPTKNKKPHNLQREKPVLSGSSGPVGSWGIPSIFGTIEKSSSDGDKEHILNRGHSEPIQGSVESSYACIQLREPPLVLRVNDVQTEHESVEISVTRLLLNSYYDIARKNIQDSVPKAIMHFLVNHSRRELQSVFIRKLYRENMFEEMLQEKEEIAAKRKRCKEILRVLQQAAWSYSDAERGFAECMSCGCFWNSEEMLQELPLDLEASSRQSYSSNDPTGLLPQPQCLRSPSNSTAHRDCNAMDSSLPTSFMISSSRMASSRREGSDPCLDSTGFVAIDSALGIAVSSGGQRPTVDPS